MSSCCSLKLPRPWGSLAYVPVLQSLAAISIPLLVDRGTCYVNCHASVIKRFELGLIHACNESPGIPMLIFVVEVLRYDRGTFPPRPHEGLCPHEDAFGASHVSADAPGSNDGDVFVFVNNHAVPNPRCTCKQRIFFPPLPGFTNRLGKGRILLQVVHHVRVDEHDEVGFPADPHGTKRGLNATSAAEAPHADFGNQGRGDLVGCENVCRCGGSATPKGLGRRCDNRIEGKLVNLLSTPPKKSRPALLVNRKHRPLPIERTVVPNTMTILFKSNGVIVGNEGFLCTL